MGENITFQCSSCGCCCRNVGKTVTEARKALMNGQRTPLNRASASFPFKWNQKGECEKLGPDGRCTIYETRPDICNVEKSFEKLGKGMTKEEYFSMNGKICNILITTAKLDKKFLVKDKY